MNVINTANQPGPKEVAEMLSRFKSDNAIKLAELDEFFKAGWTLPPKGMKFRIYEYASASVISFPCAMIDFNGGDYAVATRNDEIFSVQIYDAFSSASDTNETPVNARFATAKEAIEYVKEVQERLLCDQQHLQQRLAAQLYL